MVADVGLADVVAGEQVQRAGRQEYRGASGMYGPPQPPVFGDHRILRGAVHVPPAGIVGVIESIARKAIKMLMGIFLRSRKRSHPIDGSLHCWRKVHWTRHKRET